MRPGAHGWAESTRRVEDARRSVAARQGSPGSGKSTSRETPVDVCVQLAALWTTIMIIVASVDLFSLYRADIRANIEAGQMFFF